MSVISAASFLAGQCPRSHHAIRLALPADPLFSSDHCCRLPLIHPTLRYVLHAQVECLEHSPRALCTPVYFNLDARGIGGSLVDVQEQPGGSLERVPDCLVYATV